MLPDEVEELLVRTAGQLVTAEDPGKAFRESRERYDFTQEWLATRLGVRRETLSRIESGHHSPSLDAVRSFARLMALAAGVRAHVARQEAQGGTGPDPLYVRRMGSSLGLTPEVVEDIVREAIRSYAEKRASVLGSLGRAARRPRSMMP